MDLLNDLLNARCSDPFGCLGLLPSKSGKGLTLTVWQPGAESVTVIGLNNDKSLGQMTKIEEAGLFQITWPRRVKHFFYRIKVTFADHQLIRLDPYQFSEATFTDLEHHTACLYKNQGANPVSVPISKGLTIDGTRFVVYAPAARSVSVVGDMNAWDGRAHPMSSNGDGLWRLFIPDVGSGHQYKYEIRAANGEILPHR